MDSTKLAANASPQANRTLDGLRAEAERILGEAAEIDAREDELYGERRGDELPEELADPRTRQARIRELLERAGEREREVLAERERVLAEHAEHRDTTGARRRGRQPDPGLSSKERRRLYETKYNLTDPDSAIVRYRGMLIQGYNVQTAVADGQVILAINATNAAPDHGQLTPILEHAQANLERVDATDPIRELLADTGYWHTEQITELQDRGLRVLIPPAERPTTTGKGVRPEVVQMRAILSEEEFKSTYARRKQIVEPVFAHIRHIRQITRLLRRGKDAVQAELDLIATTHNILKLYRHPQPALAH